MFAIQVQHAVRVCVEIHVSKYSGIIFFFYMFNLCFHGETCRTQPVGLRLLQPQTPSAVASGSRPKGFVDKPEKLHAVP